MKWDARNERVRSDDTLRKYAALSQTFCLYMFRIASQSYRGAHRASAEVMEGLRYMEDGLHATSHTLAAASCSPRHSPKLFPPQGRTWVNLSWNRNRRAARSFAIPASISLSRPQGALNYGSKYIL